MNIYTDMQAQSDIDMRIVLRSCMRAQVRGRGRSSSTREPGECMCEPVPANLQACDDDMSMVLRVRYGDHAVT
jgi:hypothetical protein